ncbi:MAG: Serine/threonine-protein phosphatase 2A activator 1 [Vezdaea aestivalis]|nr:MAG: Serine/threonine-protein phosphatase 2A activator 1 [Vezdaea aestivalis]
MATKDSVLEILVPGESQNFSIPSKQIHNGQDLEAFHTSKAYLDIMTFLFQLNRAMFPVTKDGNVQTWETGSDTKLLGPIIKIRELVDKLDKLIEEAPPDTGPRRFGNVSFRTWLSLVEENITNLFRECLPVHILTWKSGETSEITALSELKAYLLASFGSAERLDYGTGHELSFLAFLGCLWKLGTFSGHADHSQERGVVLEIMEPYFRLVRRLILTYNLEPAGSHGVWGLDDHSFLPYIFGSAQLSPAITDGEPIPTEGSINNAPQASAVCTHSLVERERQRNMYFAAIGFIYDVKKGPFWEHSPMLYDISGISTGWAKINKGMIKMYNVEVLSKFPVVQHFPFGSLLSWEQDPAARPVVPSMHSSSQPIQSTMTKAPLSGVSQRSTLSTITTAPWARPAGVPNVNASTSSLRTPQDARLPISLESFVQTSKSRKQLNLAGRPIFLADFVDMSYNTQSHNSSESIPVGVDNQRFQHADEHAQEFQDFLKEAHLNEARKLRKANFHIGKPPAPDNASFRTPVYQRRYKHSRINTLVVWSILVISLGSTAASIVILVQDLMQFGPRAIHVIWFIASTGLVTFLGVLTILLRWRHHLLVLTRAQIMQDLEIKAVRGEAASVSSSALAGHIRDMESSAFQATAEAQRNQMLLSQSLERQVDVTEGLAREYAHLRDMLMKAGIAEDDLRYGDLRRESHRVTSKHDKSPKRELLPSQASGNETSEVSPGQKIAGSEEVSSSGQGGLPRRF